MSIDVVEGIFDKFILCPNTDRAREFFIKSKFTCATLDGYVVNRINIKIRFNSIRFFFLNQRFMPNMMFLVDFLPLI